MRPVRYKALASVIVTNTVDACDLHLSSLIRLGSQSFVARDTVSLSGDMCISGSQSLVARWRPSHLAALQYQQAAVNFTTTNVDCALYHS